VKWEANKTLPDAVHPPFKGQIASAPERLLAPEKESTKTASVNGTAAGWRIAFRCLGAT